MRDDANGSFTVAAVDAGGRLDVYLVARLGCSRERIRRGIEVGDVRVNGRPTRPSHKLRGGDEVEAELPGIADAVVVPDELPLSVLHEDGLLIVVDKPAGMVVHPAGEITRGTLANALTHRWGAPPWLVHRLDRDTSGVLVAARTEAAHERLTDQFRGREVSKHYVALVYGRVPEARGRIDAPLDRDRKNRLKMIACAPGEGREALTLYEVRERWDDFTLLDVEIKTGRTHQIRVHCAHVGHPVVADAMYGKGRPAQVRDAGHRAAIEALGRQFLHAARLGFEHPGTGERIELEAPLPEELRALLELLRQR